MSSSRSSMKSMSVRASAGAGPMAMSVVTGCLLSGLLVLAVGRQRRLGLAVELHQRHAGAATALQSAAGTAALAQQQRVRDRPEPAQPIDSFGHEGNAGVAADLADAGHAVRVDVEERVTGVAAG